MSTIANHQLKSKIKQGDEVIVIAGKDKGKQGVVKKVIRKDGKVKLIIEGVNVAKKHVKPNPNANVEGGIVNKEAAIDASNVKIFNSATGKGDRVGYRLTDNNQKVRVFKSSGELIDSEV